MVKYMRDLLSQHSEIKRRGDIYLEFTGMQPEQFAVRAEPTEQVVKRYLNGDTMRRFTCVLAGLCDTLSEDDRARNDRLYNKVALWLETQTRLRKLPAMRNGAKAITARATGGAYIERIDEDGDAGGYVMQIELIYYQKARSE